MSGPAFKVTEPSSPGSSPDPAGPPAKDMSPETRRILLEAGLMGGGALLIMSSIIHLLLWSESYRDIGPIGPILVFLGVVGILQAVALIRFGTLGLALASAIYLAVTTIFLLLVSGFELLGYQDGLARPYSASSIIVPIIGIALLVGVAWLISPPKRRAKPAPEVATEAAAEQKPLEPSTLIPATDEDGVQRIRWPAERQQRMRLATEVAPEPPAPTLTPREAILGEEVAAEAAAPAPEEAMVDEVVSEQEVVEVEVVEVVPEPETAVIEAEAEPVVEAEEELPQDSTEELAAVEMESIPDSIHEPIRSLLIREQEILERLSRALGPDDPGTLTIRGNIAGHYLAAGDVWRAADLQEAVAADSARILGASHPHTLTAQGKAAQWRRLAKKKRKPKVPVS
jgi:hypothetical protein